MLNYEERGNTNSITVVVEVLDDGFKLLSVKGRKKPVNDDFLSDIDWFSEYHSQVGTEYALFGDGEPIESGKHMFVGKMVAL